MPIDKVTQRREHIGEAIRFSSRLSRYNESSETPDFRHEDRGRPATHMVLREPTRVSQHEQPSLIARPPPRMPASEKSTGKKEERRI
jgi:hypothetical protein